MKWDASKTQGILTVLALLSSSALNYGYTLVLGRILDPVDYGAFGRFMSLFIVCAALPVAFQQISVRQASGQFGRQAWRAGALLGLLVSLLSPWLASAFGLPWYWTVAFGATLPAMAVLGAWRGTAQRDGRATAFGVSLLAEHGVKVLLTLPLLLVVPGPFAAVIATLTGVLLALLVVRPRPASDGASTGTGPEASRPAGTGLLALVSAGQSGLVYGDVLLAGLLLSGQDAGVYTAAATLARVVFFAGWTVQVAIFPMVVRRVADQNPHADLLRTGLLATMALAGLPALLFILWPAWSAQLAFGPALGLQVAPLLRPCAAAALVLAIGSTLLNHVLAAGGTSALRGAATVYLLAVAALTLFSLGFGHQAGSLAGWTLPTKGLLIPLTLILLAPLSRRSSHVLFRV